jgi:hypothetical protein
MSKKTEAKCNGSMLTVGFHSANPPLIWRFDLERNHSFTLALQGEEGEWELGITTPKGDFYPVVHFVAREDAEEAFNKVEKILAKKRGVGSLIVKALLGVAVLALLVAGSVIAFATYINRMPAFPMSAAGLPHPMPVPSAMPEGIPLSADDVLKPPAQ